MLVSHTTDFLAGIASLLSEVRNAVVERQSDTIAESDTRDVTAKLAILDDAFERIAQIQSLLLAVPLSAFSSDARQGIAVRAAAVNDQFRDAVPTDAGLLTAITELQAYVDDIVDRTCDDEPWPDIVLVGAELTATEFREAIDAIVVNTDWAAAQVETGVIFPPKVMTAPIEISAGADGYGGQAEIRVSYPVWTSKSLQYGLVHVARTQWLPKIQAAKGAKATGTIAPAIANPPGAQLVGVQFATDRKRATDNTFTKHGVATIQEMTWGRALVSIPNTRKRAELPRPPGILGFHLPEDSRKHMMVHSLALMDRNQFIAEAASDEDQAFLFVHGYNTPFESGLRRTAQLAVDLGFQKNVFHYAWPSAGNLLGYNHDQNAVRAAQTPFLHFLETLLDDVGIKGLNVVAHSLGNDLALESFAHLATIRKTKLARHLVLASPDVALNVARPLLSLIPAVVDSMTLYANNHDRALFVSRAKSGNERIGGYLNDNYPHIQAGLDTIDAADANFDIFGLNHDAYIDSPILIGDLEALLMRGTRPPNIRNPVIREAACPRGDYFKIDT